MKNKALYANGVFASAMLVALTYQGVTMYKKQQDEKPKEFHYITEPLTSTFDETEQSRLLQSYTENEFATKTVTVGKRVHVAIGFANINSVLIEGNDGVIIIDAAMSKRGDQNALEYFRNVTSKPLKGVIITNCRHDKTSGLKAILDYEKQVNGNNNTVEIFAHKLTKKRMTELPSTYDAMVIRNKRALGDRISSEARFGPGIKSRGDTLIKIPKPIVTFTKTATYQVAGVTFQLIHTPGVTEDQIAIWLPNDRVLLSGENFGKSFPAMYSIQWAFTSNPVAWFDSLDKLRALAAEHLVPTLTAPISGFAEVSKALQDTRDAVKFIHDQTLRLLNKGFTLNDVIEELRLPNYLEISPYLPQHLATVPWSIRSVFSRYSGWFSDDPMELNPITSQEEYEKLLDLVKYAQENSRNNPVEILLQHAQKSLKRSNKRYNRLLRTSPEGDKWAFKLANFVGKQSPNAEFANTAKVIKISALRALGISSISIGGRNYLLQIAEELEKNFTSTRSKESRVHIIKNSSAKRTLDILCSHANGRLCTRNLFTAAFRFMDVRKNFTMTLRNSVCDVLESYDIDVTDRSVMEIRTTTKVWGAILAGDKRFREEFGKGNVDVDVRYLSRFYKFMSCFDPPNGDLEFSKQWE